jgi:hypothetical protein
MFLFGNKGLRSRLRPVILVVDKKTTRRRRILTANPEDIVAQAKEKFSSLVNMALRSDVAICMRELEQTIMSDVLELGRLLVATVLAVQAPTHKHESALHRDGAVLPYHSERIGHYQTIFGTVPFSRSYYWSSGPGHYEMDAILNLPPTGPSDFLRMFLERLSLSMSYEESSNLVAEYFPVSKSTRCVQELFEMDSQDATDYYAQSPKPTVAVGETILVVQADCKGVPVVRVASQDDAAPVESVLPGKLKGPPKREGKKKMATVVAVATYAPIERTADQIVDSLFEKKSYQPAPSGHSFKRVWATMQGKEAAVAQSRTFVGQVLGALIMHRVLLTDGEVALKRRFGEAYPDYTHVLDLLHALSYLWLAAEAKFGAKSGAATGWVRAATLRLLQGGAPGVVDELYGWAESTEIASKFQPIEKAAWYLDSNLSSMRYDEYLAKGWPIATGMIEGACRHVVKDRCERSGQRWTEAGVEGMLRLRCVEENGDWGAYHEYRIRQRQRRVHGRNPQPPATKSSEDVYRFKTEIQFATAA